MTDDGRLYIAMRERLHISSCYTACMCCYTDLAGVNGCVHIYPQVVNLLCKWHVDRYLLVNITAYWSNHKYDKLQGMAEKVEFIGERPSAEGGAVCLFVDDDE